MMKDRKRFRDMAEVENQEVVEPCTVGVRKACRISTSLGNSVMCFRTSL